MKNKIVEGIFLSFLVLILVSSVMALDRPPSIGYEEPTPSWFQQLFSKPFDVIGGSATVDTVTKGNYVDYKINLKFYHDCEKYKFKVYFIGPSSLSKIGREIEVISNYPHKTGDTVTANLKNLPTEGIPDSYCDKKIYLGVYHYSYYDGAWHKENSRRISDGFTLNCPSSSHVCSKPDECINDYQINYDYHWSNIANKCQYYMKNCPSGQICEDGACKLPDCQTGNIGSQFCKNNAVYQKIGRGLINGQCSYEDRLVQQCTSIQECDGGNCIDIVHCGDGICNFGETYNTCPGDCEKPFFCGDNVCNSDETQSNCCDDCGCLTGYTCINNKCESFGCSTGKTKTIVCESGETIITHNCVDREWKETNEKCPTGPDWWVWALIIGITGGAGTGIYFMVRKR